MIDLVSASLIVGRTYVQVSEESASLCRRSANAATWAPARNATNATWTAIGMRLESDGDDEIAAAANSPVHRPTRHVSCGLVISS